MLSDVVVTQSNGEDDTQLGSAPAPPMSAACNPCLPVLISDANDATPRGAVAVPMENTLALWNIADGCTPTPLSLGADGNETVRGRAAAAQNRTVVVTSRGTLIRVDAAGNCNTPLTGVRRIAGSLIGEPVPGEGGDLPANSGCHREGGDQRGAANASCAQSGPSTFLPLLPALALSLRRRRW